MRSAERRRAARKGRTPRALFEADFLLLVDDEARQGALRFRMEGPFLAPADARRIPLLVELPRLLSAAERVVDEKENDEDLRVLLASGSSLGGVRPKASVRDHDGRLALAKFPHERDGVDVVSWEAVALSLARKSGVDVPEWRVERIGKKPVFLVRRFDRADGERIPFLSAMGMLGASDNEPRSYLEIADVLRQHGAATRADLIQLWRRIALSVLISNVDDHLRNHGFLHAGHEGWRLSPAYDLKPTPADIRPRALSTSIDMNDPIASIELALETAEYYGLKQKDAKSIAADVGRAVAGWERRSSRAGRFAARNRAHGVGVRACGFEKSPDTGLTIEGWPVRKPSVQAPPSRQ